MLPYNIMKKLIGGFSNILLPLMPVSSDMIFTRLNALSLLLDFNKVTIELIDPNKLLNPTMCKEKNMRSIEE